MLSRDGYPPLPQSPQQQRMEDSIVTEVNLLDVDSSPEINYKTPATRPLLMPEDATLVVPTLRKTESEIQSAPPTIYSRFMKDSRSSPPSNRKNLKEMFQTSNASSTEFGTDNRATMLTFPSVTDSAPSEWADESMEVRSTRESLQRRSKDVEREKSKEREREKSRPRTPKKYPRSGDDNEETESLWHKSSREEDSEEGSLPPDLGSIRLVETSAKKI